MQISLNNYKKLLLEVQKTLQKTEQNIVKSVNHEKILMSWQIGKIINDHLLENRRAQYGKKLFAQLSQDIKIAEKTLYQMRAFYKTYSTLPSEEGKLTWSHYRSLVSVKDSQKRQYLEDFTVENALEANELQQEIAKLKPLKKARKKAAKISQLAVQRGRLFTYKIAQVEDFSETFVDCGFNIFTQIKTSLKGEGLVVESLKESEAFSLKKSDAKASQLHTYKAQLSRVVDGDTIHVTLDLGFKIQHKEILRLAKISAPELSSEAGKKSAETLKKILKDAPLLIVKTNKTDIYGRYIADVFFGDKGEIDAEKVAKEGVYLNQALLDAKAAKEYVASH